MLRYEIQKYGGSDGLKLVDRPLAEPGDRDVVVRIKAASLNYRDLVVLRGKYDRNPVEGRVPLSDGAGEVVAVGIGAGDDPSSAALHVYLENDTPEIRRKVLSEVGKVKVNFKHAGKFNAL